MGFYKNTNGVLTPIAGRGRAEYGASTVRTGKVTIPANTSGGKFSFTFDTPMTDTDYIFDFQISYINSVDLNNGVNVLFNAKQKTGADLWIFGTPSDKIVIDYTAFKLYTDTEYNSLLELPDRVEALETVTTGTLTVTNGGLTAVNSNIGSVTVNAAKVGHLVSLTVSATNITNPPTAGSYDSLDICTLSSGYRPPFQIDVTVHFQGNEVPYIMNIRSDGAVIVWQWGELDAMTGAFVGSATYITAD